MDLSQAFSWMAYGLYYKLRKNLPHPSYKSYLIDRNLIVKLNNECSTINPVQSGVPQGKVLCRVRYPIRTIHK